MTDSQAIKQYYFSTKSIIKSMLFTGVSMFLTYKCWINSARKFSTHTLVNNVTDKIIGCCMLSILLWVLIVQVKIAYAKYRKIPGLTISSKSIFDYYSGLVLPWTEIESYNIWGSVISFTMKNPQYHIRLIRNPIRRNLCFIYYSMFRKIKFFIGTAIFEDDIVLIFKKMEEYDLLSQGMTIN